jgi:hypothetical protein
LFAVSVDLELATSHAWRQAGIDATVASNQGARIASFQRVEAWPVGIHESWQQRLRIGHSKEKELRPGFEVWTQLLSSRFFQLRAKNFTGHVLDISAG